MLARPNGIESARLVSNRKAPSTGPVAIKERSQPLPLSFAQQRLWFIDQLDGGSPQYNIPLRFEIHGSLNLEAFEGALMALTERHEILRTTYATHAGEGVQIVQSASRRSIPVDDLTDLDPAARRDDGDSRRWPGLGLCLEWLR